MIALLTDFGLQDIYVGVMKSVILSINPHAVIIDLTHGIAPQNIEMGAFALASAWTYLPKESIVLGVVDPGVGTTRRAVAVGLADRYFVGPDNGLVSYVADLFPIKFAAELTNTNLHLSQSGATFHGRDIFAPVAAHLRRDVSIRDVGAEIDPQTLVRLESQTWRLSDSQVTATIMVIDRFGNMITNLPHEAGMGLRGKQMKLKLGSSRSIALGLVQTYGEAKPGELVLIPTSFGTMEIALRDGSAADMLNGTAIGGSIIIEL